jgi:hypothetical protein
VISITCEVLKIRTRMYRISVTRLVELPSIVLYIAAVDTACSLQG